jgi:hypothetical protein
MQFILLRRKNMDKLLRVKDIVRGLVARRGRRQIPTANQTGTKDDLLA